ncbi:asparagine synthase (glutamine-hydrolyzing) [Devosia sp. LjRoot16]|uniref:asparagine synthase (glutamine-hydrolyzing) n=1 Tax=Devosia sp. LjRoot16 TaxID=3342271 RepID=UPI003ECF6C05
MCGIAGFLGHGVWQGVEHAKAGLTQMAAAISSRGPDDSGLWVDEGVGVGLAHRRLSIVDLSPAGHQPMHSASGRYVIVYNGEVYNHDEIRRQLDASGLVPNWRGHSDTETLLAGFDAWGIEGTLERCVGMFAFALWDRQERTLTLARDRLGEKPLYYGWQGEGQKASLIFGSELKALRRHRQFYGEIDRDAISLLMRHNYIPAPYSIYRNIFKLPPGCLLTVRPDDGRDRPQPRQYWSLPQVAEVGRRNLHQGGADQIVDELEHLLKQVIGQQMVADVPLGAFLSGGVDSSTIVALMQAQAARPVRTFTIGFDEHGYDEAVHAREVATHLGTNHTELYVSPEEAMAVIPELPTIYDEPFSDSSQIPTYLVSRLARQHVTVSLSGDGGDEVFCGYTRYTATAAAWGKLSAVPRPLRRMGAAGIRAISPAHWDQAARFLPGLRKAAMGGRLGDKLHKAAGVLGSSSVDDLYMALVSHWSEPAALVLGAREPPTQLTGLAPSLDGLTPVERMMALDMVSYLPDDILTKVDRAAMSVSLETRVPLLDHRLVEFAWRLPQDVKLRDGEGKWALKQVLYRYVPRALIERPKMGFGVPLDSWLRGPLREWADALLEEGRLRRDGYFDYTAIQQKWREHLSGQRNWAYHLWDVLMFQAWQEAQLA